MNYSFWGNTDFSAIVLEELISNKFNPNIVITFSPKTFGRKKILQSNPVEILANKHKIPVIYVDKTVDINFEEQIKQLKSEIGIVASFGKIISKKILKTFQKGLINIHPSLLPKYRGPTPIQTALINNETETGVSLFIIDEYMDHGPIIGQMQSTIEIEDNFLTLSKKLAILGAKLTISILPKYLNQEITIKPQEESLATYTKKYFFENCKINWNDPTTKIYNFIRALSYEPGTYTNFYKNDQLYLLKIIDVKPILENNLYNELYKNYSATQPGSITSHQKRFFIKTYDSYLEVLEVHLEGKNKMSFNDFYNGNQITRFE